MSRSPAKYNEAASQNSSILSSSGLSDFNIELNSKLICELNPINGSIGTNSQFNGIGYISSMLIHQLNPIVQLNNENLTETRTKENEHLVPPNMKMECVKSAQPSKTFERPPLQQ
jgi:hypothetical protein